MEHEIWVWAEYLDDEIRESSIEMLGEARKLADKMKCKVCAFLIGECASKYASNVISYGADIVNIFEDQKFSDFGVETYLYPFSSKREPNKAYTIFVALTPDGLALAPRLAAKFQCGYAANAVTTVLQPDGSLKTTVPVYMGKAHCVYRFEMDDTTVIAMKPGSVGVTGADEKRTGETVMFDTHGIPKSKTQRKGYIKADPNTVAMDETEDVVAAGSGFKIQTDIELLRNVADILGAVVGSSKPVVDKGWIPRHRLIGISSGRRISPRICLCVGISGSSQFIEGMKESRTIIAINKDKGATLMKMADLALVGDLYEILPEIESQLKAR